MSNDPFTFDLFGNTALSSGVDFGITAFAADFPANDDDDDPDPMPPAPAVGNLPSAHRRQAARARGANFVLDGERGLAAGWKDRARDNIDAIRLAAEIEAEDRPATPEEQARLIKFIGFGATDLANGVFCRPGETAFRKNWQKVGADLLDAVNEGDYSSLARCTQYAHFTPEFIVRTIWACFRR